MPVVTNTPTQPHASVDGNAMKLENVAPGAAITIGGGIVMGSAFLTGGVLGVLTGGVGLALGAAGAGVMLIMNGDKAASRGLRPLELTQHQLNQQRQQPRTDARVAVQQVIETAHELNQQKALQMHAVAASVVNVDAAVEDANLATTALLDTTPKLQLALVIAAKSMRITEDELKRTRDALATVTHALQSTQAALAEKDASLGETVLALKTTQAQLTATAKAASEQCHHLTTQPTLLMHALDKQDGVAILNAELACLKTQFTQLESKYQQHTQTIKKLTACLSQTRDENKRLQASMAFLQAAPHPDASPNAMHAVGLFRA